jgi:hypothetical protein
MQGYRLFGALDGQDLMALGEHWRIEVFSVVEEPLHLWVQLRLVGRLPRVLTLCLSRGADAKDALKALTVWLVGRSGSPVLDVA